MPEKEAEGRISTLKKNKSVTEKKRIEQIDDVFVDLSLKIRELSEKEITAKVRRKLLGNVDLENLPKLVAEINGIWAGKRKITVSKAVLPEGNSILQQVLYQEMDRRNAEKNARGDAVRPEVEACVPLEVKLEWPGQNYSFYTLMNENLKVENIASFLNGTMKIRDFRRFLAEEIIRAESLRFAIGRNDGKLTEIVKFCLASTLAYKYEKRDGRVFFVPDHAWRYGVTHSLPESEFVLAKDVAGPYAGYAFFVGVGMPKSHMDTFVGNSYAAKLGFGWFSEKYGDMKRKSRGIAEWTDSITDDDAARLETEFRELARKFMKTCDALSVGNYVIDQAGEKGRLVAETGKYLDMLKWWNVEQAKKPWTYEYASGTEKGKELLEKLWASDAASFAEKFPGMQQSVRDSNAAENVFRTGTARVLQAAHYMEGFDLYEAFAPGTSKDFIMQAVFQSCLAAFVKYRVADIQYAWEEEKEKGDRARSYQETKEFTAARETYLEKAKAGVGKLTKAEELAKLAIDSQLAKLFSDVELDLQTDPVLFKKFEKESLDFIARIGKFPQGNKFKVRKLGNHKALGLYYPEAMVLVVDVDSPSSFVHEYGHLLDYKHGSASGRPEFEGVFEMTLNVLKSRFDAMPASDPMKATLGGDSKYNFEYYARPSEVFARAFETFCALRLGMDLSILKPKSEYLANFAYVGDKEYVQAVSRYFGWLFSLAK